jgi:hypothetical protein
MVLARKLAVEGKRARCGARGIGALDRFGSQRPGEEINHFLMFHGHFRRFYAPEGIDISTLPSPNGYFTLVKWKRTMKRDRRLWRYWREG